MSTAVEVKRLDVKSHDKADEVRAPNKTRVEIVRLGDYTLGRFTLQPGWRWSDCIKPVVGTESCQLSHVGHVISGSLTIQMRDGARKTMDAGMSYTIPPGHDAWVEGDKPFVGIEVLSAEQYAKR